MDSRVEVREARLGTGLGLFARMPIKKGAFIIEYTGTKIPTTAADESGSRYLFEIDEIWTLDGPVPENVAGYINHDCHPNVEAEIEDGKIMIYAQKAIAPGEEFSYDYAYDREPGDEVFATTRYACRCGSKICRGTVLAPE